MHCLYSRLSSGNPDCSKEERKEQNSRESDKLKNGMKEFRDALHLITKACNELHQRNI